MLIFTFSWNCTTKMIFFKKPLLTSWFCNIHSTKFWPFKWSVDLSSCVSSMLLVIRFNSTLKISYMVLPRMPIVKNNGKSVFADWLLHNLPQQQYFQETDYQEDLVIQCLQLNSYVILLHGILREFFVSWQIWIM